MNLKQKLSQKMKKTGGFTLIEMLIVVAIIAILVVVSIPMVSSSLDKAKQATDDANERAAKAAAMIQFMTDGLTVEEEYFYNAESGIAQTDKASPAITGYNQKEHNSVPEKEGCVKVTVSADGTVATDNVVWESVK